MKTTEGRGGKGNATKEYLKNKKRPWLLEQNILDFS